MKSASLKVSVSMMKDSSCRLQVYTQSMGPCSRTKIASHPHVIEPHNQIRKTNQDENTTADHQVR
jgi:hypothetical protein